VSHLPIGQAEALGAAVSALRRGRVAQAQLIVGPAGAGKGLFAETVAQAQFCRQPDPLGLPCGTCRACTTVAAGAHPDVHWTPAAGKLGIEEARAISAAARMRPAYAEASVFIVEACERLTGPAAGALLKTLEDPPGPALFLFLASHPEQMEPTLRSRCLPVRLRPVQPGELVAWLLEQRPGLPESRAAEFSSSAGGWPGRALALADAQPPTGPNEWRPGSAIVQGLLAQTLAAAVQAGVGLAEHRVSPALALAALRDAFAHHHGVPTALSGLLPQEIAQLAAAWQPGALLRVGEACLAASRAEEGNVNVALNWEVLFIRLRRVRDAC